MNQTPIICLALLGLSAGVCAQDAPGSPDLFSLSFAPAPPSSGARIAAPTSDAADAAAPAASAADAAVSEPVEDAGIDRLFGAVADLELAIAEEAALNGPQSRALIEHYRSMASLYAELGDPLRALAASEQATAVVRMNDGLHTLDQAELVRQSIEMLEAAGAFSESDELQDELLDLAGRNDGDARAASIVASVADRQMSAVETYLEEDIWPRARAPLLAIEGSGWAPSTPKSGRESALTQLAVIARQYDAAIEAALADDGYKPGNALDLDVEISEIYELVDVANDFVEVGPLPRNDRFGPTWEAEQPSGDRDFAVAALHRARRLYSAAMQAALRARSEPEYRGLDEQLVETYYFEAVNPELSSDINVDQTVPSPLESVLRARVADRMTRGAPPVEVARAMLELADALGNREALARYQDAYDFLVAQGASAETVAGLFDPPVPVIRRAFGPEDSSGFDPARVYRGYIDAEVETGRFGQTTEVEIVGASAGTSREIARRLRKHVSQTRFRSRFADGEPVRSDRFVLRYYYDYDLIR